MTVKRSSRRKQPNKKRPHRARRPVQTAPTFDSLESRHMLAAVTVGNSLDLTNGDTSSIAALIASNGGDGISLREAITASNNTAGADTISFDGTVFTGGSNSLIRLIQGQLTITETLTIDASTATDVTITGDANDDDITVAETFITDVDASIGGTAGGANDFLNDNSRILNFTSSTGNLTVKDMTITGGRTTGSVRPGAGIRFASLGALALTNSTVSGNNAIRSSSPFMLPIRGAGIYANGDVSLISSVVSGNRTLGDGGGIYAKGDVSVIRSTVSGNNGSGVNVNGGGIFANGDVSVISSTVSGNSASGSGTAFAGVNGGGIFANGDLSVISSTVSGNTAGDVGGGIFVINNSSSITISNSIVAGNTDGGGAPDLRSGTNSLAISYSLIGATDLTITGNGNQVGTLMSPLDPLLGPLADNGGPTQTLALLAGSPAIDAGSDALAAGLSSDQRGFPFVRAFDDPTASGASVDIGSFEVQTLSPILVVDNRVDENDGDLSAGNFSLREAIDLINDDLGANTITFDPSVFTGESNSLIRLTQGELVVTETVTIDASAATDVTITGDADDNDVTNTSNITDVIESFARLDDNSRVLNFDNPSGDLTLNSLTITGGRATGFRTSGGGGIRFASSGDFALTNSTVSGNSSSDGGGIYSLGDVSLTNSTVSANLVSDGSYGGGGLLAGRAVSLVNSTVSENFALTGSGGGIFTRLGPLSPLSLLNSTISGNLSLGAGGGIYTNDPITATNSIIAGNFANTSPDLEQNFNSSEINYSLIGATDSTIGGIGNQVGTLDNPLDPLLGPLADNGGPTLTHALLPGSPAIDAGADELAVNTDGTTLINDQRGEGFSRTSGSSVDMGAFELQASIAVAPAVLSTTIDEGGVLARPDLLSTFAVTFDQDVNVSAADLTVRNDTVGGTVINTSGVGFSYVSGTRTATWDFSTLVLDAAFYTFELSDTITGVGGLPLDGDDNGTAGGNYAEEVYVAILGDANLDGRVDVLGDAFILINNLGTTTDLAFTDGNFNDDGRVDVLGDAFTLINNLGRDVRPPTMASSSIQQSSGILPVLVSADGDERESSKLLGLTSPMSKQPQLVLAGDYDLRDDIFGSEF
ncbi:right-handed parallel beta-helix repeat-containing protein [Mariniblastus sp.]|nr:right-handed parallel beta-helix repeat-containing protein [Mariniblastus sp.]